MERIAIEYLANAFWQLPLLAGGAWLLLHLWKPSPATQHRVWLSVLALGLLMPLRGIIPLPVSASAVPPQRAVLEDAPSAYALSNPAPGAPVALDANRAAVPDQASIYVARNQTNLTGFLARLHRVRLNATAVACILALWLATALWGLLRLALAWTAARGLARSSRQVVLAGHEAAEVLECARRLGVNMPDVRESGAIAGPVVVGAIHPVLLWPRGFRRHSNDEFKAALCHEIAHIRRCDYAMNLLCEAAAVPLKWHPAIRGLERRIRATREMACDEMAAGAMQSKSLYATCLLSLAQSMVGASPQHSMAAGLFNGNVMEERIMRLMQGSLPTTWRMRLVRGAVGAAAILAAVMLAAVFHVVPAMAQAQAQTSAPPVVKVAPVPPVVSVNPVVKPVVKIEAAKPVMNIPAVRPIVNVAKVAPVMDVNPVIHFSPVVVHIAPVVKPVIHFVPVAPIIQVSPTPPPAIPAPQQKGAQHTKGQNGPIILFDNGRMRNLTPAERARIEKQLEDAQRQVAAATAKINSPEFRKQIEDAQAKALQAETMLNSAEFRQRMAEAQKQVADATAKINSPEFKKQLEDQVRAAEKVNSAEFQKQMKDAQAAALRAQTKLNSPEFKKQMADAQKQIADATARLNSPEFKKQLENEVRAAEKVNSAEIQKQMADAQKQIADALAKMKAEQQDSNINKQPPSASH